MKYLLAALLFLLLAVSPALATTYTNQYPVENSSLYVNATSQVGATNYPWFATNTSLSLTGSADYTSWISGNQLNQRFHIDLGSAKIIRRVDYNNYIEEASLGGTSNGARNFTIWGSNSASAFNPGTATLDYTNNTGWTQIQPTLGNETGWFFFDRHRYDADVADPKNFTLENSVAYRYIAIKIANSYTTVNNYVGLRRIVMQTEDGYVAPPIASFTINTTTGTAPQAIVLNDTSSNSPTSWAYGVKNLTPGNNTWIQLGTTQNLSALLGVGNWSVNLTATNSGGSNISAQATWVNVTTATLPISSFTINKTSGPTPLTIQVNDTSTYNPNVWNYSIRDPSLTTSWYNYSTRTNLTQTLIPVGIYNVSLSVQNTTLGTPISTSQKDVAVNASLITDFVGVPTNGGVPLSVTFTDLSSPDILSWNWSFGDGTLGNTQNPTHVYTLSGVYSVSLNVTNPDGNNITTKNNYITATDAPTANFTADKYYGPAPLLVTFTDHSVGAGISWNWSFGDGTLSTLQNPTHTFTSNGEYQVNLTVTNGFGSSAMLKNISVANISSSFTGSPLAGPSPLTVSFTETTTGLLPDSYYYEFGDGNTSNVQNPTHTYVSPGYYTINNRVMNGTTVYWNNKTNYIEAWGLSASFTVSNTTAIDSPLVVLFTSTSTNVNASPSSYLWVFGDGTQSTVGPTASHTYDTTFGTFGANLTVTNTTQAVTATSAITTLTRVPSSTVSNISQNFVMNQIFPTTIMVKDSQTLALIGGSTITVEGAAYTLSNGILSSYFEYGSHTFLVEADGYASKTTSLFIVGNSTFMIYLDPINGASQTTWWTPHTVQLTIMSDAYGTRLPGIIVSAHYNESAMPTSWIETLYGIQSTAAGQMLNQTLTLGGTTGSDGTLTTSMLGSLKYDFYLTSAEYGLDNYHVSAYPSDSMLNIYVPISGQTLPTSGNSTYVYLNNTRLYMTQPNISYVNFCIDYQDFSGTTSTVNELWWFGNNNSIFGTESFINPGVSLVTNCKTLYNVRGTPVYWNYSAVTGI